MQKRLLDAVAGMKNLSKEDAEIFSIFEGSYKRHLNNEPLLESDYLLRGHEYVELNNLPSEHVGRYFLCRYKYNMYPKLKKTGKFPPVLTN